MKIIIKGWVTYYKPSWEDKPKYQINASDWSNVGTEYVTIREQDFEVDIPDDFDPRPSQLAALRAKKKEVLAEAQVKANNIDEQIQVLLAIGHKPEPVEF